MTYRGCMLERTSNISFSAGATTTISWSSATIDTDSIWNGTTRLTVPAGASKVQLFCQLEFAVSSLEGTMFTAMALNGTVFSPHLAITSPVRRQGGTGFSNNIVQGHSSILDVVPGDYFQCVGVASTTAYSPIQGNARTWCEMQIIE